MGHKLWAVFLLISLAFSYALKSSIAAGAGCPGFIPSTLAQLIGVMREFLAGFPSANWPIYQTLSPGGALTTLAIQTAINVAPAESVILSNPGTYKLHRASTVCQRQV